jgi:exoribonuclease R
LNEDECKRGYVQGHADGFGFLIPEDKSGDLLLTSKQMRLVFHGDVLWCVSSVLTIKAVPKVVSLKY